MKDKELEKAIEAAKRYQKTHTNTEVMVVYSDHGSYQGFAEQKVVSTEFQVLYRSSDEKKGMQLEGSQESA